MVRMRIRDTQLHQNCTNMIECVKIDVVDFFPFSMQSSSKFTCRLCQAERFLIKLKQQLEFRDGEQSYKVIN